jgi:glutathione S-transferase
MRLKLYGFPMSNYFNMVKSALLEKGIEFDFVPARPSQDADHLGRSPMGKVPCIETEHGCLSETAVILEYLEDLRPEPRLLPRDPYARAKVRELMHDLELYIELPARSCYGAVFFGATVSDTVRESAQQTLAKGVRAIRQLASFQPFIAGSELSHADLMAMYTLPIASRVTKQLFQQDLLDELPGALDWMKRMAERPSIQTVRADQRSAA